MKVQITIQAEIADDKLEVLFGEEGSVQALKDAYDAKGPYPHMRRKQFSTIIMQHKEIFDSWFMIENKIIV